MSRPEGPRERDEVTILRAHGEQRLAKRWSRDRSTCPKDGLPTFFAAERAAVGDARDLYNLLRRLNTDRSRCVIRGALRAGVDPSHLRRRCRGVDAPFQAAARRWVALDLDGVPLPSTADPLSPDDVLEAVLAVLPPEFEGVSFAWQLTASHGIKPGARARLWYWLDRPVADRDAKRWLGGVSYLDPALFNPVQIHFTAAPVIEGGDFLPLRIGYRDGEPWVRVPAIPEVALRLAGGGAPVPGEGGCNFWLGRIGRGRDGFHEPLRSAIGAAFRAGGSGIDQEALYRLARAAVDAALAEGRAEPADRRRDFEREIRDLIAWTHTAELKAERREPVPRLPKGEARVRLEAEVNDIFDEIARFHGTPAACDQPSVPGRYLLEASLGLGKTEAVIRCSVARLEALRARGIDRVAVFAVPTHRLADELADRIRSRTNDLRVAVLRGREATDTDGEPMCRNLDEVHDALALMLPVTQAVCETCAFARGCRYLAQQKQAADIVLVAHDRLASELPGTLRHVDIDHLIIDESPVSALLYGCEGRPPSLPVDALGQSHVQGAPGEVAPDLMVLRQRLGSALHRRGDVTRVDLSGAGLTTTDAAQALDRERARQVDYMPHLPRSAYEPNRTLPRFVRIWREVCRVLEGEPVSGRLRVVHGPDGDRQLEIAGVEEIDPAWLKAPVILLDATPEPRLLEPWFGVMDHRTVHADEPHCRVLQCAKKNFAKSMLESGKSPDAKTTCRNNRARLARLICEKADGTEGELLVVGNKGVLEKLRTEHVFPETVHFAHFNALRGLDAYGGVSYAIVVGRPQPSPETKRRIAAAICGRPGDAETEAAVERAIRDAEVEQAIGRVRGVNRTERDPVEVLVLNQIRLRRPVTHVPLGQVWRNPTPAERMLEVGGVVFASPAHAALAYPDLWASKQAAQRVWPPTRQHSSLHLLNEDCCPVRFRRPRAWEHACAWVDRRNADPRAAIEALIGPVAEFETIDQVTVEDIAAE